jgi:hypothetical protein
MKRKKRQEVRKMEGRREKEERRRRREERVTNIQEESLAVLVNVSGFHSSSQQTICISIHKRSTI